MSTTSGPGAARRLGSRILLAAPLAALLWVPLQADEAPAPPGVPPFYSYLFAWAALTPLLMGLAHWLARGAEVSP